MVTLDHHSLHATLQGVLTGNVAHFRGIPYAKIPRRFAPAESIQHLPDKLDCTSFGPRCPQVYFDVGHLLRIPPDHTFTDEPEDEFRCTNLDVVMPEAQLCSSSPKLPVLVWIHGGSQAITFGSAASGICDMTKLISDSILLKQPIIAVSVQYRLNVFATGDGTGPANLALKDQSLALEWVQQHISGFGGDPDRVTLAGESAGAVYCHAHLVTNAPARQYILASGSLYLSPPQPVQTLSTLRGIVAKNLEALSPGLALDNAPTSQIIKAIKLSDIQSWVLQMDSMLDGWQNATGKAESIMLSDVQKESAIWQLGVCAMEATEIVRAFDLAKGHSDYLKKLYHIYPDRVSSCRSGALDFITDYKFTLPIDRLTRLWQSNNKPVYRYLVDEHNPWQYSSGAHHAVDLVLLFGGFEQAYSDSTQLTGRKMREAWIKFINTEEPWPCARKSNHAFGPYGTAQTLDDKGLSARRRIAQVNGLSEIDSAVLDNVFFALAAGKVSLLN